MRNRPVVTAVQRHCSVVSLLLIAGAGLILLQGPVGQVYRHGSTATPAPPKVANPAAPAPKYDVANTSSVTSNDGTGESPR